MKSYNWHVSYSDLCADLYDLEEQELRVIHELAARLLLGQKKYGRLKLDDKRDWSRERIEEIEDLLIYTAFESLRRNK